MTCIVNVDEKWGIGRDNELLVAISDDLKRFRSLTTGKTVVLGRKTLAGFPGGRPLKNRRNIILSSDKSLSIEGAEVVHCAEEALALLQTVPADEICIIGGASVYETFLPYCHTAYVTKTMTDGNADRFFPNLDNLPNWNITDASEILEENGMRYQYVDYTNTAPKSF